jgi:magnesium-transporting ATPase (P-type)
MVQGYLTGNLQEVHKDVHENENAFVYKTSVCVSGAGRAIVVAVGANTQQLLLEKFD